MRGTASITALNNEILVGSVTGPGNFAPVVDLTNVVAGQTVTVRFYSDIAGEGSPELIDNISVTYEDLQITSENGYRILPFVLEASQVAAVGLSVTAGAVPLDIPWRMTNLGDFT